MLEGQVVGGVHMGLGHTLSEAFVTRDGHLVTDSLKSLGIIPAAGMPPVEVILVEEPQPEGPYRRQGHGRGRARAHGVGGGGALYAFDGMRRTEPADARLGRGPRGRAAPRAPAARMSA